MHSASLMPSFGLQAEQHVKQTKRVLTLHRAALEKAQVRGAASRWSVHVMWQHTRIPATGACLLQGTASSCLSACPALYLSLRSSRNPTAPDTSLPHTLLPRPLSTQFTHPAGGV